MTITIALFMHGIVMMYKFYVAYCPGLFLFLFFHLAWVEHLSLVSKEQARTFLFYYYFYIGDLH